LGVSGFCKLSSGQVFALSDAEELMDGADWGCEIAFQHVQSATADGGEGNVKIRFIYPDPNPRVGLSGRKVESAALQLLAAITPPEHDVSIVQEHLGDRICFDDANVDLVGISAMTIQARRAYQIADGYRSAGKQVVLGGIHPSVQPNEALQHADAVVVGEGEPVWSQLLADAATGNLHGLYRGKEYADLTQLPAYRRDLLPKRSTLSLASVQAARGCPYDCSFCSATLFSGRKYRYRPVANVIAEIKALRTRVILFLDDNIFSSEPYCRALFSELKKLDIIWVGQASLHLTAGNPALLKLAVESGCISLFVGIESLTASNLRATGSLAKNRASTPEEIGKSIRVLHDHNVVVMAGVIFGFDDDDPEVFDRTREFLIENRVGHGSFSALTPFPGTKLFATLQAQSRITTYDWSQYDGATAVFLPKMMTAEQLQEGTRQIGVNFYSTPKILRRFWTNRHHPLFYLATSFAWRHSNRVENRVPFLRPSGSWKNNCRQPAPAIEASAEQLLLATADQAAEQNISRVAGFPR
jgi:radical SAM superfamily enzyme YgiQ (UPF0313 family)